MSTTIKWLEENTIENLYGTQARKKINKLDIVKINSLSTLRGITKKEKESSCRLYIYLVIKFKAHK